MDTDMVYCDEIHDSCWIVGGPIINVAIKKWSATVTKTRFHFINRVPNTLCQYSQKIFSWFRMIHDNVSYRCPPDVCYICLI